MNGNNAQSDQPMFQHLPSCLVVKMFPEWLLDINNDICNVDLQFHIVNVFLENWRILGSNKLWFLKLCWVMIFKTVVYKTIKVRN